MTTFTLTRTHKEAGPDGQGREHFAIAWDTEDEFGDPMRRGQHYFMPVADFIAMEQAKGNTVEVA